MIRSTATAWLALLLGLAACDDDPARGGGGGGGAGGGGGSPEAGPVPDALVPDAGPPDMDLLPDVRPLDAARPPDVGPVPDVGPPPDVGPAPDVGNLDGRPCDPRRNAVSCGPGEFCVHVPGRQPHIGRCQTADGCTPGDPASCPDPERPYCHLRGAATACTAVGALREGQDCVDGLGIPQPCAEGLLCNNSVCQRRCDPAGGDPACPDTFRCADISAAVGVPAGLCQPPTCDRFQNAGGVCAPGEKCSYAIRNDGLVVGACTPMHGNNQAGAPCAVHGGGGDNCAQGLICIGPPNRERFCRILCDTGAYEAPCPDNQRCTEALATRDGPVRGLGICVTNQ